MAKKKSGKNTPPVSTQQYLDIAEIKDGTIVMKDGTIRAVFLASSINFALKSEDEQNSVISSYVRFLNNLSFTLQIVIQSRELNIDNYLAYLQTKEKEQINKLLKLQTAEYIDYIKELTSLGQIMNKRFYVVVPYDPLTDKHKSFFDSLKEAFRPASAIVLKDKTFKRYQKSLDLRLESVANGLTSLGVSVERLNTQQLIELFYSTYNPETAKNQKLVDIKKLRVDL